MDHCGVPAGAGHQPGRARDQGDHHHHRDENRADLIDPTLDRRLARLRVLDQPHDARQRAFRTQCRGAHHQPAFAVDGAAGDGLAGLAGDRQALAGQQRLIDLTAAFDDLTVDRNAFAGSYHHPVADAQTPNWHVTFLAVRPDHSGDLGGEGAQRIQRSQGAVLGARFQPLAQHH